MGRAASMLVLVFLALGVFGCEEETPEGQCGNVVIRQALNLSTHDVAGILYEINCLDGTSMTQYVELNDGPMPQWLDPNAGPGHPFADLFTVLPATECTVTATPMQDENTPSEECAPVSETFTVIPGETVELVLMSQCKGEDVGAGDFVVGLNDPPVLVDLTMDPGKFICNGEELGLTVSGYDPNGDQVTVEWTVISWPEFPGAGTWTLTPNTGLSVGFTAWTPGPYEIQIVGTDTYGASTSFTFPVHVMDCDVCCKLDGGFQVIPAAECPEDRIAPMEYCEVCCKLDTYQLVPADQCPNGQQIPMSYCEVCDCPEGYTVNPAGDGCTRIDTVPAQQNNKIYEVCPGNQLIEYSAMGAYYPGGSVDSNSYWGEWGQTDQDGRLNNVGVWACKAGADYSGTQPVGEWIGFSICLDVAQSGDYLVGMGADNSMRFYLNNGSAPMFEKLGSDIENFRRWWMNPVHLNSGMNILQVEGYNYGNWASFGAEISGPFTATSLSSDGAMMGVDYAGNIIFSTEDRIGGNFNVGQSSGFTCPEGYLLNTCAADMVCVKIDKTDCL